MPGSRRNAPQASILESVLDVAPFGLDIVSKQGEGVYSNKGARPADVSSRIFPVKALGEDYSVILTVDCAGDYAERQELIRRTYFDELTGLPNRIVAERSVTALISERDEPFALAVLGLDGFGAINDYFGRQSGDEVLAKLAERLGKGLRDTDMLAKLRGDEFLVLLAPIASHQEAEDRTGELLKLMRQPLFVERGEVFLSGSAGVCIFPDNGADFSALQVNASRALGHAKMAGRGSISIFDVSMQQQAIARSRTEQRLREALLDRRITCAYQPKVELATGELRGVEVLMRWLDEDGVLQPPGEFLTVANEIGVIDRITHLILDETIDSVDRINEAFGKDTTISVNIAAGQAGDLKFMEGVLDRLVETRLAHRFMLEVTEDAFMATREFQGRILPLIRETGVRVSIDDFGTGYSSLSALADITADEIKIDRSFITDVHKRPRSQSVLKAIEALAESLGMSTIAEGIETVDELRYLQRMTSIQLGQGHYFAKAITLEADDVPLRPSSRNPAPARAVRSGR